MENLKTTAAFIVATAARPFVPRRYPVYDEAGTMVSTYTITPRFVWMNRGIALAALGFIVGRCW